jgi:hypothetical protein
VKVRLNLNLNLKLQLAQVQSLAQAGGRTPMNHHQSFTDKLVEEALQFPHGASPPPHLNNMHNPNGKKQVKI